MSYIKIPRNGGPLICYKHNAVLDILNKRKDVLNGINDLNVVVWNNNADAYESSYSDANKLDGFDVAVMINKQSRSLYKTLVLIIKSCLRDGKSMEKALKAKNARIFELVRENENLRRAQTTGDKA